MKVRVCPNCGKHNLENAWHCIDCQETLSLKTLMDTNGEQFLHVTPIAGHITLSEMSVHFEQDVLESVKNYVRNSEEIIWGCNIAVVSRRPPFLFGYLIITSHQLILVFFKSDLKRDKTSSLLQALIAPLYSYLKELFGGYYQSTHPWTAVGLLTVPYPNQPLTSSEKNTRKIITHQLEDLKSVRPRSDIISKNPTFLINTLVLSLKDGKEFVITFYSAHEGEKAHQMLQKTRM
jgi:hypothetical protein